jgi:fibronectin-binding autotransporter adhesin
MKIKYSLILLALLAGTSLTQAGSHTWSGAISGNWNTDGNWSAGGKPVPGETNVALFFPAVATRYVLTNNIVGLEIGTIALNGDYTLHGSGGASLAFQGEYAGITVNGARTNVIDPSLPMSMGEVILFHFSNAAGRLTVQSVISGTGGITKNNSGTLAFGGTAANTYTGLTKVNAGTLVLNKSVGFPGSGRVSVPGPLTIGNGVTVATVRLDFSHQLANDAPVIVNTNAVLDLNDQSEVIGPLILNGNVVDSGTGLLTLNGDVTVNNNVSPATLAGRLSLGASSRTFHVDVNAPAGSPDLIISATISGAAGVDLLKDGFGELALTSSNNYSGTTILNQGTLSVEHALALGGTNAGTVVNQAQLYVRNGSRVGREPLIINGSDTSTRLNSTGVDVTNAWAGDITITTNTAFHVDGIFILSGAIGGTGSVKFSADGSLVLAGNTPNTYSGVTVIEKGILQLDKSNTVASVPGTLVVGTTNVANSATVLFTSGDQIAFAAAVDVQPSGLLDLHNESNIIGTLDMTGGEVMTGNGTLSALGNVTAHSWSGSYSKIYGHLNLLGTGATQKIWAFDTLLIYARIHGGPISPLIKHGAGPLWLNNSNSYAGRTVVEGGSLAVNHDFALGSFAEGTTITNTGSIWLAGNIDVGVESLTFAGSSANALSGTGTNSWGGPVSLATNTSLNAPTNVLLILNGAISGSGELKKTGPGTLRLGGDEANTFSGGTVVTAGKLQLQKSAGVVAVLGSLGIGDDAGGTNADVATLLNPQQIADRCIVSVANSGLLDLNNFNEAIGSLVGTGHIQLGVGQLTVGGNQLDGSFGGSIGGTASAGLTKIGTGELTLTGTNTYPGPTTINAGKLLINGSQIASAVTVNTNGTLGGSGFIGPVTVKSGKISPGNSPGLLSSGSASFLSNSILEVELNGLLAGTNCDQLNVGGTVNLGGVTLNASLGFASAESNQFVIIKNDGADAVTGSFAGLAEGALLMIGGAQFRISYVGGTGNDVVLTQLTSVATLQASSIAKLNNGQIQLGGTGAPGTTYQVQANTNLASTNWINLGTTVAQPPSGAFQFTDVNATNYTIRFYRFVAP